MRFLAVLVDFACHYGPIEGLKNGKLNRGFDPTLGRRSGSRAALPTKSGYGGFTP